MDPLTGVNVTASGLLALGGVLKVARPRPAAAALGSLASLGPIRFGGSGRQLPLPLVRAIGAFELAVAVAALTAGGRAAFALQAACFVAFTVVAAALWRRRGSVASCGCFGEVTSPPSLAHVVVTAAGFAVSLRAALAGLPGPLQRPGETLPTVLAGVGALALVYLSLVDLPRLLAAVRLHAPAAVAADRRAAAADAGATTPSGVNAA